MKLHCPDCGGPIPAADINLDRLVAKCPRCDAVFGFEGGLAGESRRTASGHAAGVTAAVTAPSRTAIVPRPPSFVVEASGDAWRVRYRWVTATYVALALFCVFWIGFTVLWYTESLGLGQPPMVALLFPIFQVTFAVVLAYVTATMLINRTTMEATAGRLSIRHGPLPWKRGRDYAAGALQQLYVVRRLNPSNGNNQPTPVWQLCGILKDGVKVNVTGQFDDPDKPRFLKQQLESRLKITPRPVAGEFT